MTIDPSAAFSIAAPANEKSHQADLSTLLAEREILRTMNQYTQAIDYSLEEQWVDCFTEDGIYEVRFPILDPSTRHIRGGGEGLHGRDALRKFMAQRAAVTRTNHRSQFSKHIPCVPLIDVNGDEATVTSHFVGFGRDDGVPVVRDIGRYRDTFAKCPDGRWRIKHRIFEGEGIHLPEQK